jgi:hypothetical protein
MAPRRVLFPALVAAALGLAGCLWEAWCAFPFQPWNEVRLAAAFALREGINPYPLIGDGPLFTWIYGPVGLLLHLPATFAGSALGAIQLAGVINALVVLGPLALILLGSAELRARGWALPAFAFTVAALLVPRMNLVFHVADHAAIAGGLLSGWCLTRKLHPTTAQLASAAALVALAVWSKQLALFLVPAQAAYLVGAAGGRTALRYLAWTAVFGFAGLAVFSFWFGFANLWLNLVAIPSRLPWAEFGPRAWLRAGALTAQVLIPALLLIVVWWRGAWPRREAASGRFFQVCVWMAAAVLPVGLAAYFKIGGDTNVVHTWSYLLPALTLVWLAREATPPAAALRIGAVALLALAARATDLASLPAGPLTRQFAVATELTTRFPGGLWFPMNPVVTYYTDRRLWHSEDGIYTRDVAGYGLRESEFRRHLPPGVHGVVYPAHVTSPYALGLLPTFNEIVKLPYWTLHVRGAPAAP